MHASRVPVWLVLAIGTVAVSTAAPLIELAALPFLTIAAWRTLGTGLLYGALPGSGKEPAWSSHAEFFSLLGGAALLAAHFGLWIAAFEHTSYASTVILLALQPLFAAALGRVVLGERLHAGQLWGGALGLAGLVLLVWPDLDAPRQLFGDGLAVLGTLALALYYVVVSRARQALSFPTFMSRCYGLAGLLLTVVCMGTGTHLFHNVDGGSLPFVLLLIVVPTVVGHACFNWCIGRVPLFTLNLLIVLEPALALVFGAWWLGTSITLWQLAGGAVLGLAVFVALRPRSQNRSPNSSPIQQRSEDLPPHAGPTEPVSEPPSPETPTTTP